MTLALEPRAATLRTLERGIVRSGAVLFAGQFVFRVSVAAYTIVLVSLLSPSDYGDFAVALAIVAIAVAMADGGITRLLTRDVARKNDGQGILVRGLLTIRTAWLAAVLLVLSALELLGALPIESEGWLLATLILTAVVTETGATGLEAASLGAHKTWPVATGQVLGAAVLVVALVAFLLTRASITSAVIAVAMASSVRLLWNLRVWWSELRELPVRNLGLDVGTTRRWVREAAPFLFLAMLGALYYRLDVVILHSLRGAAEAASYAAAYRVLDAAIVLGGVLVSALVPRLSRLVIESPDRLWALWRRWARMLGMAGLLASGVVAAAAFPIAELLFGEGYRETAGSDLRLLAPSIAFVLLQSLNAAFLFAGNTQRALVRLSLVHVAVNIALTIILSDIAGSTGAAAATTLSSMFTFVYFAVIVRVYVLTGRPNHS